MQNIYDTIEKCDKYFNETTFENVSSETIKKDIETVVDVDVDNDETTDNIDTNNDENMEGTDNEC